LLGESFEFLVVGELLAYLRNKLRPNELGGALAAMGVTELVEGVSAAAKNWSILAVNCGPVEWLRSVVTG
jgi:hypothetical protein